MSFGVIACLRSSVSGVSMTPSLALWMIKPLFLPLMMAAESGPAALAISGSPPAPSATPATPAIRPNWRRVTRSLSDRSSISLPSQCLTTRCGSPYGGPIRRPSLDGADVGETDVVFYVLRIVPNFSGPILGLSRIKFNVFVLTNVSFDIIHGFGVKNAATHRSAVHKSHRNHAEMAAGFLRNRSKYCALPEAAP